MATKRGNAKKNKADEFYTQLKDIELELKYYKDYFKNKVVFCNCDDPYESNFFKYFAINFNHLGLKKLIATCYDSSPVAYTQMNFFGENKLIANKNRKAYKIVITEVLDYNNDGAIDLSDVDYLLKNKNNTMALLKENGDFRSKECIELLKQSDIVVTNPPFSLFREYIAQLFEYNKKFIIIGNQNAITYKEIFPLLKDNKMFLGLTMNGSNRFFRVPDSYPLTEKTGKIENGIKYAFVKSVVWFTNIDINNKRESIVLYKKYSKTDYPKYDNFDAINIDRVSNIPYDYPGLMGVPITFFHKYNPNDYEIIGLGVGKENLQALKCDGLCSDFVDNYYKNGGKGMYSVGHPILGYYENNIAKIPFARVIIKRRTTNEN